MMIRVTGSALDRVARCTPSAALPQVVDANPNDDRDAGSVRHKFLERTAAVGREAALKEIDDDADRAMCSDIELAKLAAQLKLSTEVALAYNWRDDTARALMPVAPRVYDVDSTCEIAGTFDLAGVGIDAVYCGDYKGGHSWLPKPEASFQLALGIVCLARIYDKHAAHVEYIRLLDDGDSIPYRAEIDAFGIEAAAGQIREVMSAIAPERARILAGEVPTVVDGPWCRYCPAAQHCPGKTAMVRAVLADKPAPLSVALTPELAREAYLKLRDAKNAIKIFEAALYAYAKLTPIPIETEEDGTVRYFGELRRPGNEVLDGVITHRVLAAHYGGEAANKAVTMDVTKEAVKNTARVALQDGEKITKVFDALIEEIKDAGGASRPITCTTVEYTVAPEGAVKARKRKAS